MAKTVKLSDIKLNPNNPRVIKGKDFKKLCKSISEFPKMLELRPIVVDENNIVVGGNMRRKALEHLGYETIPEKWIKSAKDFTQEEIDRFIITDNIGFGEWDWDILRKDWNADALMNWNLDVPDTEPEKTEVEIQFAKELDFESNYIVLKFDTDIDWLQAKTLLGLESVYSKRANGKTWSKGIGRVVNGREAIKKIQDAN